MSLGLGWFICLPACLVKMGTKGEKFSILLPVVSCPFACVLSCPLLVLCCVHLRTKKTGRPIWAVCLCVVGFYFSINRSGTLQAVRAFCQISVFLWSCCLFPSFGRSGLLYSTGSRGRLLLCGFYTNIRLLFSLCLSSCRLFVSPCYASL